MRKEYSWPGHTTGFYWSPSPDDLDHQIDLLHQMSTNAVWVSPHRLERLPRTRLRNQGIRLYVELGLFVGEEWWHKFPDSVPIDASGAAVQKEDWYAPVCPNHPQIRRRHLQTLQEVIQNHSADIDGLWLDFIRYPVHWEAKAPYLPQTCFCTHCLNLFLDRAQDSYSARERAQLTQTIVEHRLDEWVDWKCARIAEFVAEVRSLLASANSTLHLGLFTIPWRQQDHGGAMRSIAGQDLRLLSQYVDVVSPMTYHRFCYQPVHWIRDVILDALNWAGKPVLPVVQSVDEPAPVSPEEFGTALDSALQSPAASVMVFTLDPLLANPAKAEVAANRFRRQHSPKS